MTVTEQRNRALAILEQKKDDNGYSPIDYAIDDECRRSLNLPPRPSNSSPYVGWMTGVNEESAQEQRTSQGGVKFIQQWEGCRLKAYLCPAGVWTIGYGHTKGVKQGQKITREEALELFKDELKKYEQTVIDWVVVPLTQNQFDALVSFTYNCGISAFRKSTLLKKLNMEQYNNAANEFDRWIFANGQRLPGLRNRRKAEKKLFKEK